MFTTRSDRDNDVRKLGAEQIPSHALDGTFQRALIKWPALAPSGHLLHTRLSRAEIERLALDGLARENVTDGAIALRWRYVATPTPTGEVVLRLSVAARPWCDRGRGQPLGSVRSVVRAYGCLLELVRVH